MASEATCPRCGAQEETINHLLFECPPALQVWALASIPSAPGIFPRPSLAYNLDFLFWRCKELKVETPHLTAFPWILWYIWKARNEKAFNGKEVSPLNTLEIALAESRQWESSRGEEILDTILLEEEIEVREQYPESYPAELIATCWTDASWIESGQYMGLGWSCTLPNNQTWTGISCELANRSALHAEMDGLLFAMKTLLLKEVNHVIIKTDCLELVKMTEDQENWPAFSSELDVYEDLRKQFMNITLSHIPRSRNMLADYLAKQARKRNHLYSYVSTIFPN